MILQVPTKNGDFHRFPFIYQFCFLEATTFANMFLLYLFRNHSLLCMLSLSHPICITSPCGTLCSHGHVLFRLHLWCPWVPQILAIRPFWYPYPHGPNLVHWLKQCPPEDSIVAWVWDLPISCVGVVKKTVSAFAGGSCAALNLPFLADNPCDDASAFHRVEAAQARDRL